MSTAKNMSYCPVIVIVYYNGTEIENSQISSSFKINN